MARHELFGNLQRQDLDNLEYLDRVLSDGWTTAAYKVASESRQRYASECIGDHQARQLKSALGRAEIRIIAARPAIGRASHSGTRGNYSVPLLLNPFTAALPTHIYVSEYNSSYLSPKR